MKTYLTILAAAALSACTAVGPTHTPPALPQLTAKAPAWNAPLPHGGDAKALKEFWASWNDPGLTALIDAAQKRNASLDEAAARITQARLGAKLAGTSQLPEASGGSSLTRGAQGTPAATNWAIGAQALWEMDLFGGKLRSRESAAARVGARERDWHDARVSIAAEVAMLVANIRVNEALLIGFEQDQASRAETARLTQLKTNAGFEAPANAALAQAAVADAQARVSAQQGEIALSIKGLTALTELAEADVRTLLAPRRAQLPPALALAIANVPAQALAQRPDLAAIERELAAAIADIGVAEADRYPRITFSGSLGFSAARMLGATTDGATWGFGPAISIPLFDSGRRATNVELVRAQHTALSARYRAAALRAIREVEEALARLQTVDARLPKLRESLVGYEAFTRAAQTRLSAGVGTVLELEDARRAVLGSQVAILNAERDRLMAWISLYRALGGGWSEGDAAPNDEKATAANGTKG
jgi:outer membrane protein, multidrug efflux system